jgi:hypothetical protein
MNTYLNLQGIQELYCIELDANRLEHFRFDEYLRDTFVQVYDENLNYLGWELK